MVEVHGGNKEAGEHAWRELSLEYEQFFVTIKWQKAHLCKSMNKNIYRESAFTMPLRQN